MKNEIVLNLKKELKERILEVGVIVLATCGVDDIFDKYVDYSNTQEVFKAIDIMKEVFEEIQNEKDLKIF